MSSYVTIQEAQDYFTNRLHSGLWDNTSVQNRQKALAEATAAIDRLRFVGDKNTVYVSRLAGGDDDALTAAFVAQELEFPRGTDEDIPSDIIAACCEEAFSRLDGKDPDEELENLAVSNQGYASVRTTYDRSFVHEHLNAGIVSPRAWRFLKPYLDEVRDFKISRV